MKKEIMLTISRKFHDKIKKSLNIDERIYHIFQAEKEAKFDVGEKHKQIFVFKDNSKLEIMTKSKKSKIIN